MKSYSEYFSSDYNNFFKTKIIKENEFNIKINDDNIHNRKYFINYVAFTNFRDKYHSSNFKGKKFSNVGIFISRNTNDYYNLILECSNKDIIKLYTLIEKCLKTFDETNILDSLVFENLTSDIKNLVIREV